MSRRGDVGHGPGAMILQHAVLYLHDTYKDCFDPNAIEFTAERDAVTLMIALETILMYTEPLTFPA